MINNKTDFQEWWNSYDGKASRIEVIASHAWDFQQTKIDELERELSVLRKHIKEQASDLRNSIDYRTAMNHVLNCFKFKETKVK